MPLRARISSFTTSESERERQKVRRHKCSEWESDIMCNYQSFLEANSFSFSFSLSRTLFSLLIYRLVDSNSIH
jgi:hypothetical protein